MPAPPAGVDDDDVDDAEANVRLPRMGVVLADETTGRQAIGFITP